MGVEAELAPVPSPAPSDPRAFARWVEPHLRPMAALATRLAPHADRDDVVQDALVRAWRRRSTYDPSRGSARGWLLAIVADQARRTRTRRKPTVALAELPARSADHDRWMDLERALTQLTERQRLAVDLVHIVGATVAEAAVVMRCAEGTVKSTLSDARARIRALMEVSG